MTAVTISPEKIKLDDSGLEVVLQTQPAAVNLGIIQGGNNHAALTVGDTASLDLVLVAQHLYGNVDPSGVDHDQLLNYEADQHFSDAPSDGNTYGRNNAAWSIISSATSITVDTKANIIASFPTEDAIAFASDVFRYYIWIADESKWYESPVNYGLKSGVDIGVEQDSSLAGYGLDYISDKRLSHVLVGSSDRDEEGSIRAVDGNFQIYLNGVWNDIVINFRFREDSIAGTYELEHKPVGLDFWYEVASGNSNKLGIDGKPIAQQYTVSMGTYQPDLIIDGGAF